MLVLLPYSAGQGGSLPDPEPPAPSLWPLFVQIHMILWQAAVSKSSHQALEKKTGMLAELLIELLSAALGPWQLPEPSQKAMEQLDPSRKNQATFPGDRRQGQSPRYSWRSPTHEAPKVWRPQGAPPWGGLTPWLMDAGWRREAGAHLLPRLQMGNWSPLSHMPSAKTSSLCCYRVQAFTSRGVSRHKWGKQTLPSPWRSQSQEWEAEPGLKCKTLPPRPALTPLGHSVSLAAAHSSTTISPVTFLNKSRASQSRRQGSVHFKKNTHNAASVM